MKQMFYRFIHVSYHNADIATGPGVFSEQTKRLENAICEGGWSWAQTPKVQKTFSGTDVYFVEKEVEVPAGSCLRLLYDVVNIKVFPDRLETA